MRLSLCIRVPACLFLRPQAELLPACGPLRRARARCRRRAAAAGGGRGGNPVRWAAPHAVAGCRGLHPADGGGAPGRRPPGAPPPQAAPRPPPTSSPWAYGPGGRARVAPRIIQWPTTSCPAILARCLCQPRTPPDRATNGRPAMRGPTTTPPPKAVRGAPTPPGNIALQDKRAYADWTQPKHNWPNQAQLRSKTERNWPRQDRNWPKQAQLSSNP